MNFQKLFEDYHIPYSTKVNRGWVNIECPFCTSEHPMHLGFNLMGDYCTCWNCGSHELKLTLRKVLSISNVELKEVMERYEGRNGILLSLNKKIAKAKHLELPNGGFTPAERKYLLSRNFSPRFLHEKYGVVGGGIAGRWKHRIIIPVYQNGKLVSWTGRSILDKQTLKEKQIPRYKNLSIEESVINIKECLFNIDNCKNDYAVLVEGSFDVMRLGDDFLCSMGTELTQSQIQVISSRFKKIFIAFDNEPEAQKKARKFGMELASIGVDVEVVNIYEDFGKNDGGELDEIEVQKVRSELFSNIF